MTAQIDKRGLLWAAEFKPPVYLWGCPTITRYGFTRDHAIRRAQSSHDGILARHQRKAAREKVEL